MRLRDYLRPDLILTDLRAADTAATLEAISAQLERAGVAPASDVLEGLSARERAHTTAIGAQMALPHTTVAGLADPVILVALAPVPVPFGPPENEPTRIFFTLLSPPGREGEHIKLLARICRLVRHTEFVDELLAADSPAAVLEVIRRVDELHV